MQACRYYRSRLPISGYGVANKDIFLHFTALNNKIGSNKQPKNRRITSEKNYGKYLFAQKLQQLSGEFAAMAKDYDYLLKVLLVGDSDVGKHEILAGLEDGTILFRDQQCSKGNS